VDPCFNTFPPPELKNEDLCCLGVCPSFPCDTPPSAAARECPSCARSTYRKLSGKDEEGDKVHSPPNRKDKKSTPSKHQQQQAIKSPGKQKKKDDKGKDEKKKDEKVKGEKKKDEQEQQNKPASEMAKLTFAWLRIPGDTVNSFFCPLVTKDKAPFVSLEFVSCPRCQVLRFMIHGYT